MGSTTASALLLLLLAAVPAVFAVTFKVSWTSGIDYTDWVTGKTFRVGDSLEFQYGPSNPVSVVDKSGYDLCDGSGAVQTYTDGETKIDLTTTGTIHFLCPTSGHCQGGMKLAVLVLPAIPSPATPSPQFSRKSLPPSASPLTSSPSPYPAPPSASSSGGMSTNWHWS